MTQSLTRALATLGWKEGDPGFWTGGERPGRVSIMHGSAAEVIWFPGDEEAETTVFELRRDLNLRPVAGDWVAIEDGDLTRVAERRTTLKRPDPNGKDVQVMAAGIDTVLIVLPVDLGLNPKNLERLAIMAWDSGADPLVVLTKADAAESPEEAVAEAEAAAPGVPVLLTSSADGRGLDELRARMGAGTTTTMLGASGAGKTSLLNALEGHTEAVAHVSRDGQGRHTTTTRKLYRLASGGVLLDLPGIRSLDLLVDDEALGETFADITALAASCRFADCSHEGDQGCAVEAAVAAGTLPERRLASWRAIRREMAYQARRNDPAAMAAERQKWKQLSKSTRKPR
ncbi:putative ribosome biogenesis GTPase RsgA [Actinorhabdospora filicis]|uniref:Small ribosomal subunit biogenesis GTPase RsgA n=1 Tax=Actinorhabdospora filicis TaxID=1785913 RepID=A0A9W6SPI9_9ACTN|nr:ribosome small subunit-dependent GTPase A [Actinorhabdospora filicis]GLZ79659.1 putative ribosome biogenesis GTPase RsgA [Actinorhabdospora filicis]